MFILFIFFYASFVVNFFEGYRTIYGIAGSIPLTTYADTGDRLRPNIERAREVWVERKLKAAAQLRIRKLDTLRVGDSRHRLRWLYFSAQATAYHRIAQVAGPKLAMYSSYLHNAIWMTLAFAAIYLSVATINPAIGPRTLEGVGAVFFGFFVFMSSARGFEDPWSLVEMATIAIAIFLSLRRKLLWFLLILFIATANRETGAGMGMIYAIINWRKEQSWILTPIWIPIAAGPIFQFAINYELLTAPEFWDPSTYVSSSQWGYVVLSNVGSMPLKRVIFAFSLVTLILAPLVLTYSRIKEIPQARRVAVVTAMYTVVLLSGTYIGNLFAYLLMLPSIVILLGVAYTVPPSTDVSSHT